MFVTKCVLLSKFIIALALVCGTLPSASAASTLSTVELAANSLTFTCTKLESSSTTNGAANQLNVVLLHGFPMNRSWYDPLLRAWQENDALSINAIACDLRGYSSGASPDAIEDYRYDILASDVFALASAAAYSDFHLVGHDHGAGVGWLAAALSSQQPSVTATILSYTAMSVPHTDLFSTSLCGENEIQEQVVASNYFNQFSLPDSAAINDGALTTLFASFGLVEPPSNDTSSASASLQKKLWWYNGAAQQYWSLPRVVNDSEVPDDLFLLDLVRQAIPMEPRPCVAQQAQIGAISIPVLFVCGAKDPYLLCTLPEFTNPANDLISDHTYYEAESCGHDFFLQGDCEDETDGQKVIATITDFITSVASSSSMPPSTSGGVPLGDSRIAVRATALILMVSTIVHALKF